MKTNMILSASGWRKIFAETGNEQDKTAKIGEENRAIAILVAKVFADYLKSETSENEPIVLVGRDTRPTGTEIVDAVIKSLLQNGIFVKYCGIVATPEIMASSKTLSGFLYISASHNPIGHNGIKFGLNNGGVLGAEENSKLIEKFTALTQDENAIEIAKNIEQNANPEKIKAVYEATDYVKLETLSAYKKFAYQTIGGIDSCNHFDRLNDRKIGVVCDMNGSARCVSIDKDLFFENNIDFYTINDVAGEIAHEIIPEKENLCFVAREMERLQVEGKNAILGYMPDCDGDRGNVVYWNEKQKKAVALSAQEVFSLSVLAELSWQNYLNRENKDFRPAVVVNCPTSMRINEIAAVFNAKVFRAEVGEANVVQCAKEKRAEGFDVRILGEGSNGGTITYPSSVRDPINTIFAIIKLLCIKDLYKFWCEKTGSFWTDDFSLQDIIETLPKYTTTGVSEKRAILHIKTKDHALLKSRFQNVFLNEWSEKKDELFEKFGVLFWECVITNGTKEKRKIKNFGESGKGGLKIIFYNEKNSPLAFFWMRGSGTEPVFRILCDVKGENAEMEAKLLEWETKMLEAADK